MFMTWHAVRQAAAAAAVLFSMADRVKYQGGDASRVVFSITTHGHRLPLIKAAVDSVLHGQTRPPDAVYLSVGPDIKDFPDWLMQYNASGKLRLLQMARDYGPASKLLAALKEGGERSDDTIIVYGDDDMVYSDRVVEMHVKAQLAAAGPTAFGTRRIAIGQGSLKQPILEAVGTISLPASVTPDAAFAVASMPDVCYLSDDFWLAHHLTRQGVQLELLPGCQYDWGASAWPRSGCGAFEELENVRHVGALSEAVVDSAGSKVKGGRGDWRDQLKRYEACQRLLTSSQMAV